MINHDLDFATGYYCVFPAGFRDLKEDTLVFSEDCPEDIKKRVLELWPKYKAKVEDEWKRGIVHDIY